MLKYILKRLGYMILTLFIVASITFFMMKLMPGTPFSNQDKLSAAQLKIMNEQYGLNKPIWQQYLIYLGNLLHGDFGTSFQFSNQPVLSLITSRLKPSLLIGSQAMIIGSLLGILLGAVAAINKNNWIDSLATFVSIVGISVPSFVLGVLLQFFIAFKWHMFPIAGFDNWQASVLPSLALAVSPLAQTARFMRTEMVDVLNSDYIELSKAKGNTRWQTVVKHTLRNSLIPVITILGPLTANILTGSLVVENIFSIPGIGEQFVKSIMTNDYPTIMGLTIFYALMFMVMLLITDILYSLIDPRIRLTNDKEEN
ncbi:oligopeptide ABC transporter permease [Bombilactobacillus thymidiniphilus]|uniref:ABC transporter permease n=1 Tax=Bombilactobacillus thymidiniphilus TaxID=2923363 RepID=A0ABY4PF15_9LACO|nr:oligopeptide ABC transporter permease [Bombilactobacillus thymidiniphilus]UQS84111.1 ABC transporter permease [Bombilactobacillus thymidiniphilus]